MKTKIKTSKFGLGREVDKRQLVNLDLYNNEIRVMEHRLSEVAQKTLPAKEARKLEHLKLGLKTQKENLEKFRQDYEVEEMTTGHTLPKIQAIKEATNAETFFEHLKSFENNFKDIRRDVNEFIGKHL
jgi:hypothetical protein